MQSVGRGEAKTILLTHEGFQPVSGMVRDLTPRGTQLFAIKTPRETNAPLCLVRVSSRALTQKAECQQEGLKQGMERRLWKEQKQGLLWEALGKLGTDVPFAMVWLLLSMCTYFFFN